MSRGKTPEKASGVFLVLSDMDLESRTALCTALASYRFTQKAEAHEQEIDHHAQRGDLPGSAIDHGKEKQRQNKARTPAISLEARCAIIGVAVTKKSHHDDHSAQHS